MLTLSMRDTRKSGRRAFTLIEIMIVVAILGTILAIAVPGFLNARLEARAKGCVENQEKLFQAIQQWALAMGKSDSPVDTDIVGAGNYLNKIPTCPATRTAIGIPATLQEKTSCPTNEPRHTIEAKP